MSKRNREKRTPVRGNTANYTPEKPLFGKYIGSVYRPDHERGLPESIQEGEKPIMIHNEQEQSYKTTIQDLSSQLAQIQQRINTLSPEIRIKEIEKYVIPPEVQEELKQLTKERNEAREAYNASAEALLLVEQRYSSLLNDRTSLEAFDDSTGEMPPALVKALCDPFDYAIGLRDGRVIRFQEAKLCSGNKWICLDGIGYNASPYHEGSINMTHIDHNFPRGIDVRISDIMWVADAPEGS